MDPTVDMMQMLEAREKRASRQQELLSQYGLPIISFCMNIPGPVKNSPVIRRGFREGMNRLGDALRAAKLPVLHEEQTDVVTGCEAILVVRGEGWTIKKMCVELEDRDRLGRLFDMDVLVPNGDKLDRKSLGHPERPCLVCGQAGKGCASRRLHSVEELQNTTFGILRDFFAEADGERIADQAVRALLWEVCTTPKPGLVDRANNGSHQDMTVFTFLDSVSSLIPYLRRAVSTGQETASEPPSETFWRLRMEGITAEREMFRATGGVNTHKGAIFSLGTLCGAVGRLWRPEKPFAGIESVLAECASIYKEEAAREFDRMRAGEDSPSTAGEKLFLEYGMTGIRGELARGLPSVRDVGLPALENALSSGSTLEEAGVTALLKLIAMGEDTNLAHRGGMEGLQWAAEQAKAVTQGSLSLDAVKEMDREFIRGNLSPGGCADLLSLCYFLHFLWEVFSDVL